MNKKKLKYRREDLTEECKRLREELESTRQEMKTSEDKFETSKREISSLQLELATFRDRALSAEHLHRNLRQVLPIQIKYSFLITILISYSTFSYYHLKKYKKVLIDTIYLFRFFKNIFSAY